MKLYTGTGDEGYTLNYKGETISKDSPSINLVGTMDELTSVLGFAKSLCTEGELKDNIDFLQGQILVLNKELSGGMECSLKPKDLEKMIDGYEELTGSFKGFIKPGETKLSAALDIARTVARRAERTAVEAGKQEFLDKQHLVYLNRLSDLLYAMARYEATFENIKNSVVEALKTADKGKVEIQEIDLDTAKKVAEKIEQKALNDGLNAVIAFCDKGGNLILLHRMQDAFIASIDIAINKAFTSAALKMTTKLVGELSQPGAGFYGVQNTNGGRIVIFGGGVPLKAGDAVIGGLGVSGGTAEQDADLAEYGAKVFEGGH